VHPVDYGTAVAWGDEEDIDLSAGAIFRLAKETMRPDDMRAFIAAQKLTETSLAAILDYLRGPKPPETDVENLIDGVLRRLFPAPRYLAARHPTD
jgi:hypothetical protein